jgi:Histidine phosphatase superfamily (branch 1)
MRAMRVMAIAAAILGIWAGQAVSQSRPSDGALVNALRDGGHVLVMRHCASERDQGDIDPLNFKNIKKQRQLTEQGKASAKAFGGWLRAIGAPIGEVVTSKFHRAQQTAVLAGFAEPKISSDVTEGGIVVSANENSRRAEALRQLLTAPLPLGKNRLIITHKQNITEAFGKEWFEVKEGETSIFKIEAGSYRLVARLQLDEWARLAQAAVRN